jgi:alkanesulfonate monooxygenase SsuD/methylene tetrahydromethanopterin reductase-like flavin-dependent oxidoreductase (luciferase family)
MALKDQVTLGMSLPHRSPEPIDMRVVRQVAQRADALGFRDLWVTENTLDHVFSFDPVVILTYAATVPTSIRVGVSVAVLPVQNPIHVAHQFATLDYASNGRAILGVGLGRDQHYTEFRVPREHRIRRFREEVELIKALWTEPKVSYRGSIYQLETGAMSPRPVQKPHPPIWLGGGHPDAIRRAAVMADGWMGAGGSSHADFARLRPCCASISRRRAAIPAFDLEAGVLVGRARRRRADRAEPLVAVVYRNPAGTDARHSGNPEQICERLEELVSWSEPSPLNPVSQHAEPREAPADHWSAAPARSQSKLTLPRSGSHERGRWAGRSTQTGNSWPVILRDLGRVTPAVIMVCQDSARGWASSSRPIAVNDTRRCEPGLRCHAGQPLGPGGAGSPRLPDEGRRDRGRSSSAAIQRRRATARKRR